MNILRVNPVRLFLSKSESCEMTALSATFDKTEFDEIIVSFEIGEEDGKRRYVYIGGDMICPFLTYEKFYKYISKK